MLSTALGKRVCLASTGLVFEVLHVHIHRTTIRAGGPCGHRLRVGLVVLGITMGIVACGNNREDSSTAEPAPATAPSEVLRLTPEESMRIALEVTPVVSRGVSLAAGISRHGSAQ
jgi:hypothetical protein